MEQQIARDVMLLRPAKKIWDTCRLTYGYEKNISRVFEIYEQLFTIRQGEHSIQKHFTRLRALLDELEMYQPLTGDISQMKKYREELAVSIYLFNLNSNLSSQIRGQVLGADSLLDLQTVLSKSLPISTGTSTPTSTSTSTPESSAMAATRGRGHGDFRGNGRDRSDSSRRPKCTHCGRLGHQAD